MRTCGMLGSGDTMTRRLKNLRSNQSRTEQQRAAGESDRARIEQQEGGEVCECCKGVGSISYNPNLNPAAFPATTTAKCPHCGGGAAITDPCGSVMQGTDEFVQEMQGLRDTLNELYVSTAMLRVTIIGMSPKVQRMHAWEWNTESMQKAEAWVRP